MKKPLNFKDMIEKNLKSTDIMKHWEYLSNAPSYNLQMCYRKNRWDMIGIILIFGLCTIAR